MVSTSFSIGKRNRYSTNYVNALYGRVTKRTLLNEAAYTYAYDALGRLTKQTGPQGLSKTYSYDVSGNLVRDRPIRSK